MSIFYLAAVASAVTLIPTDIDQPRKAQIDYSDLNLSSSIGQKTLDRRLQTALNMVCGYRHEGSFFDQKRSYKCRKQAMAQIEPQRQAAIEQAGGTQIATKF